jgi:hypothetical protein
LGGVLDTAHQFIEPHAKHVRMIQDEKVRRSEGEAGGDPENPSAAPANNEADTDGRPP